MLTPFRGFWDTQSEIDRMFNDMMRNFIGTRREVLHYDLPGVRLEDVDITLDGNVLTISGERKALTEERVNYYLNELPYGAFRRSVSVPEGVDADAIKARFENGVLEVVLAGAVQEIEPKKIAIEGATS
jgi:HSP20 family protein